MKIRPVGAGCSMWMDRQTDMSKLTVALRKFANAPNKLFQFDSWGPN